jgi:hypothetical protein
MLKQIAFLVYLSTLALGQFPTPEERQRIQELTNADHRHLLEILHIQELRPGRNGSNPQAPNYANYDESKANPFPNLPDPLLLKNGKKVTSPPKTGGPNAAPKLSRTSIARSTAAFPKSLPRSGGKSRRRSTKRTATSL